jgi:hypothetical protein
MHFNDRANVQLKGTDKRLVVVKKVEMSPDQKIYASDADFGYVVSDGYYHRTYVANKLEAWRSPVIYADESVSDFISAIRDATPDGYTNNIEEACNSIIGSFLDDPSQPITDRPDPSPRRIDPPIRIDRIASVAGNHHIETIALLHPYRCSVNRITVGAGIYTIHRRTTGAIWVNVGEYRIRIPNSHFEE